MSENAKAPRAQNVVPILDSQNPPISIDGIMITNAPFPSSLRMCGFSGTPYPVAVEKGEGEAPDTVWVRPTTVVDYSPEALLTLFTFISNFFDGNHKLFTALLERYPDLKGSLSRTISMLDEVMDEDYQK